MTRKFELCWSLAGVMALLVTAGCTVPASSAGPPEPQPSAATPVAGPATSILDPQREDAAFGDIVTSTGLDSGTAAFMMLSGSTLEVVDGHTFVLEQAHANGATSRTAFHLYAGSGPAAGEPPTITSTAQTATEFRFSLSYAVAAADLPAELLPQVLGGLPGSAPAQPARDSALAAIGLAPAGPGAGPAGVPAAPMDGSPTTVDVLVDGVISQSVETGIDKAFETTKLDKTQAGTSWEAFKSGAKIWEAVKSNGEIADALQRIAAARECAANPTNPLTVKDYADHPGAKEAVIKQLDEMSDEVTANAAVLFSMLFTDAGAGLIKAAPWLGFITSPAINFIKDRLGPIIEGRAEAAEKLVPECKPTTYRVTGGGRLTVNGTIASFKAPFTVNAAGNGFRVVFQFAPDDADGTSGSVSYEGWGGGATMTGSGRYTITGKDPGPYKLKMKTSGCVDIGKCANNADTFTLTPQKAR